MRLSRNDQPVLLHPLDDLVQITRFAGDRTSKQLPGFNLNMFVNPLMGLCRQWREHGDGTVVFGQDISRHFECHRRSGCRTLTFVRIGKGVRCGGVSFCHFVVLAPATERQSVRMTEWQLANLASWLWEWGRKPKPPIDGPPAGCGFVMVGMVRN